MTTTRLGTFYKAVKYCGQYAAVWLHGGILRVVVYRQYWTPLEYLRLWCISYSWPSKKCAWDAFFDSIF